MYRMTIPTDYTWIWPNVRPCGGTSTQTQKPLKITDLAWAYLINFRSIWTPFEESFFMKRVDWLSATAFEKLPSWPCGSYFDIFFIWKNHISDFTTTAIVIRQTPDYRVKLNRNERSRTSAGVSCKYLFILVFRVLGLWHNFFDSKKIIERRH